MPNFEFKGEEELLPGQRFMTYQNRETGHIVKLPKAMLQSPEGRKQFNAALGYGEAPSGEGMGDFSPAASEFGAQADAHSASLEPRPVQVVNYPQDERSTVTYRAGERETQMPRNMLEDPQGIEAARQLLSSLRDRANEDVARRPAPEVPASRGTFWEGVDQLRLRAKALRGK